MYRFTWSPPGSSWIKASTAEASSTLSLTRGLGAAFGLKFVYERRLAGKESPGQGLNLAQPGQARRYPHCSVLDFKNELIPGLNAQSPAKRQRDEDPSVRGEIDCCRLCCHRAE